MTKSSEFLIENDSESPLPVSIEPEGALVTLEQQETLVVKDDYDEAPVTIRASCDPTGAVVLCIWPGDGNTRVEKDGKDVLAS